MRSLSTEFQPMTPATSPFPRPVIGIIAYSGAGKTTLLTHLLPLLGARGLRTGLVKHAHHGFDPDIPGKDSYRLRKAGAVQTLVASPRRWALFTEAAEEREPHLDELLAQLDPDLLDLVLVEGFRGEAVPKIEVHRPDLGHPPLFPDRPDIIAVACDAPPHADPGQRPLLDLNDPEAVAGFLVQAVEHARR